MWIKRTHEANCALAHTALRAKRLRRASNPVRFQAARLYDSADFSRSIGRSSSRSFATLESQRRPRGLRARR